MSTAWIVGGLLLVGLGLVASQLFRLRDWLARQPPPTPSTDGPGNPDGPDDSDGPDEAGGPVPLPPPPH